MRIVALIGAVCLGTASPLFAQPSTAGTTETINVQPSELGSALQVFSRESGVHVVYISEDIGSLRSPGAVGVFTPAEALQRILRGTGLTYRFLDARTVTILPQKADGAATAPGQPSDTTPKSQEGEENASSTSFRMAQMDQKQAEMASPVSSSGGDMNAANSLSEIVVTASHRAEVLSHVGSAVSAISGDELLERSADSLQDYVALIPGLTLTSQGAAGYGVVAIRGIAPQGNAASTATYIDEVPVGASGATTRSDLFTADLDPEDLQRVEVLKGPQGTLYGASSMGGVIKYVTRDPSLTGTQVTLSEDGSYVEHGSAGTKLRGAFSAPLIDGILGIRASGYYRHDPGFVDDLGVQGGGMGRNNDSGGRLALLYKPNDAFSAKLSAMVQENRQIGLSVVDTDTTNFQPTYGAYDQLRYEREGFSESTRLYSAEIHYRFGVFDLLSATGYSQIYPTGLADDTLVFQDFGLGPVSPANPAQDVSHDDTEKFTQEFRLTSGRLGIAEFMLGAFYQHEKDQFSFVDSLTLTPDVNFAFRGASGSLSEYAGFGDATLYFSPRFDLTVGYRYSRIDQDQSESHSGELYNPVDPNAVGVTSQSLSEGPSTYLIAARYHVNEDLLFYARAASGYRPGGGRALPPGTPPTFGDSYTSDKLWSYEVGEKYKGWNGRLTADADAFYIDWTNIQSAQPVPGTPFVVNGNSGAAHIRGAELQAALVPFKGVTVGVNAAYTDAIFTETVPGVVNAGDTLTYVPKLAGSGYAQYTKPIGDGWNAVVQGDYRYEGYRVDTYRVPLPGYGVWDSRFGMQNDRWQANFYIKNLSGKYARAGSNGGGGAPLPYYFVIETPRTFGISLIERF